MNNRRACLLLLIAASTLFAGAPLRAQPAPSPSATEVSPPATGVSPSDDQQDEDLGHLDAGRGRHHHRHGHDLVNVGRDSDLPLGQRADSVVSIAGSSSAEGDARDVVSVFGNTKVTGSVSESAVAVLGNTFVDGPVGGDVVAVLGNVELGPHADVHGNVVAVGGRVQRDPDAQVHGSLQTVVGEFAGFDWLRAWIDHCLFYGRPLALAPGLGWAWGLALSFLVLYTGLALLFPSGVSRCEQTLDTQPGMALLAALITVLVTPLLLVLLCITFVGVAAVPLVVAGLFGASLFGKAVVLAWLGHRLLGAGGAARTAHPAAAVLLGGALVLVLYLVPVLGFVIYKVLGLFGLGAVVYTLMQWERARRAERREIPAATAGGASAAAGASAGGTAPAPAAPAASEAPPGAPSIAPVVAAGLPRAGFWIRMMALLLDCLLVGFLMGALRHSWHLQPLVLATYGAIMWKLRGSTVGGIVFDLQVVRLDDRAMDWETAVVRALACFLSLAVAGLGFFWIAFDPGRQAWHDKIAGTAVVRVRKGVAPA